MKKESLHSLVCFTLACVMAACVSAQNSNSADAHIKNVIAITRVYSDGLKVSAVAVEYDKSIRAASVSPSAYTVKTDVPGQKITGVYTSTDGGYFTRTGPSGQYVVLKLSTDYVIPVPTRSDMHGGPPSPGARPEPHPAETAAKVELPPNPEVLTKVGNISWNPAAHPATLLPAGRGGNGKVVTVTQIGSITATDGTIITAGSGAKESNLIRNMVVDGFMKPDYIDTTNGNLKYNIHFPRNYDPNKKYPLVIFLTDRNDSGSIHADALIHGNGGDIWAERDEEAQHEAIVVAPLPMHMFVNEKYEAALDIHPGPPPGQGGPNGPQTGQAARSNISSYPYFSTLNLIDYLLQQVPSIDKDRIYLTGQGDGARTAIKMMIDRPGLFAAALLFAPDYDPAQMARLSKANLWIVASEGDAASYPKMESCMDSLKAAGARVSRATWNGQSTPAQFASDVRSMIAQGGNIKFAVLKKGTTLPSGIEENAFNVHAYTWRIGYSIQGLRDWLLSQKK